jgi:DNA-binding CsgD family transcriptional regulator
MPNSPRNLLATACLLVGPLAAQLPGTAVLIVTMLEEDDAVFAASAVRPRLPELTARERDILALMAERLSNAATAARLGLSEKTVRNNVSSIYLKLRVLDREAAIARARER